MTSGNSPIIEYYPPDFKTDLNGKQQEWEAVVLIPFIDEVHTPRNLGNNNTKTNSRNNVKAETLINVLNIRVCGVCAEQRCLLAAMESCNHKLTEEEKGRNRHTECAVYWYDPEKDFKYPSNLPQIFPDIVRCHVRYVHAQTHASVC